MGRPLNKRFFQSGTGTSGFQVGCNAWFDGEGSAESSYIISQRSNTKYLVGSDVGGATPTRTEVLTLVQGAPAAAGEAQVEVTIENAQATSQATVTFTAAGGTGALLTVVIANAGYGYWAAGTGVALGGVSDGTIDYTVANGSLATVSINSAGTANTDATVDIGDTPAAFAPQESARIINARKVKTFEGNTFVWPATGGAGSGGRAGITEANLQAAT